MMKVNKGLMVLSMIACLSLGGVFQVLAAGQWVMIEGNWMYRTESNTYLLNTWFQDTDSKWYHFDGNGHMETGWIQVDGFWFNLNPQGILRTGWLQDQGAWYYLSPSTGAMKTGWLQLDDGWYYLTAAGTMKTGWLDLNNVWYYFNENGLMTANTTLTINGTSYTFGSDGAWTGSSGPAGSTGTGPANVNNEQSSKNFAAGSWSGTSFRNTWSNIGFTAPDSATIYTAGQMKAEKGSSSKILVNDGTITSDTANAYTDTVVYDFIVKLSDGNSTIQLSYINVASGGGITAAQYAVSYGDELVNNATLPHILEATEKATLGGKEYVKLKTTMLNRTTNQDVYIRRLDNFIVMVTATYTTTHSSAMTSALANFKAIN